MSAATYDNLEIASTGTKTAAGSITNYGNFTIGASAAFNDGGTTTNYIRGNWTNNGTFTATTGDVEFTGPADSILSGASTFNRLRVNKSVDSVEVRFASNNVTAVTVDMVLGTMNTGTNALTLTTARTGSGVILGTITRTHAFADGPAYAFESPSNYVMFASGAASVSSISVNVQQETVPGFPYGASINRLYSNSITAGGAYSATLRLHYADSELNGNSESTLSLWQKVGGTWTPLGKTANNATGNWAETNTLANISGLWTLSDYPNVAAWNGSVSTAWENPANWTLLLGSPSLPPVATDVALLSANGFGNQPTINSAVTVRSILFSNSQPVTLTIGTGGSLANSGNIAGAWSGNATHTINVGSRTLSVGGDLSLSDGTTGHAINLSLGAGTVTVQGNLVESGGADITFSGAGNLNLYGDFHYTSGNFTPGSGTVTYTGSGAQTVAPVTYNHLVMDAPSGISTLASSATVNGNLTLLTGGTLHLDGNLTVAGNVSIGNNTILDPGPVTISVGGNWVCNGTFNANNSEVVFNGTGVQSIAASTFYDLDINKASGTATLAGNILVAADTDTTSGTLDLSTFTLGRSSAGATLSLAAGTTLRVGASFPSDFASKTLNAASTVEYYGSSAQTVAAETYGNLILTNGTTNAKTLASATTVSGNLLVANNAMLSAAANSLNLQGNWTNNGTFSPGSGTVVLGGTSKAVAGATTFTNLTVSGSYTVANSDITIKGNLVVQGSYVARSGTTVLDGDLSNFGSLSSSRVFTFSGTRVQTFVLNSGFVNSGTVNFNGTFAPSLHSVSSPQYQNVNINNTAGVTTGIGWIVNGAFIVNSGAAFNGNTFTHNFYGTVTNNGTMTTSGTLNFSPTSDSTLVLGTGSAFATSGGLVIFGGTKQITLSSGALSSLGSVEIANTHATGITPASVWTLGGNLQIDNGATFHAANLILTIAGTLNNGGIFDGGTSTVVFNSAGQIAGSGSTTFSNLFVSGTLTCGAGVSIAGNFTNNGTFSAVGADVTFTGGLAT